LSLPGLSSRSERKMKKSKKLGAFK
jgi:hypothetical protein